METHTADPIIKNQNKTKQTTNMGDKSKEQLFQEGSLNDDPNTPAYTDANIQSANEYFESRTWLANARIYEGWRYKQGKAKITDGGYKKNKKKKKKKNLRYKEEDRRSRHDVSRDHLVTEFNKAWKTENGRQKIKKERYDAEQAYNEFLRKNKKDPKPYPDTYANPRQLPVVEGNFFRLFQLFQRFLIDQHQAELDWLREKTWMRQELADLRKALWIYRRFANGDHEDLIDTDDEEDTYSALARIADEKMLFYLESDSDNEDELPIEDLIIRMEERADAKAKKRFRAKPPARSDVYKNPSDEGHIDDFSEYSNEFKEKDLYESIGRSNGGSNSDNNRFKNGKKVQKIKPKKKSNSSSSTSSSSNGSGKTTAIVNVSDNSYVSDSDDDDDEDDDDEDMKNWKKNVEDEKNAMVSKAKKRINDPGNGAVLNALLNNKPGGNSYLHPHAGVVEEEEEDHLECDHCGEKDRRVKKCGNKDCQYDGQLHHVCSIDYITDNDIKMSDADHTRVSHYCGKCIDDFDADNEYDEQAPPATPKRKAPEPAKKPPAKKAKKAKPAPPKGPAPNNNYLNQMVLHKGDEEHGNTMGKIIDWQISKSGRTYMRKNKGKVRQKDYEYLVEYTEKKKTHPELYPDHWVPSHAASQMITFFNNGE